MSIIQNISTGFDTEYENEYPKKFLNKLLSVQLAIQTRTLIKVPLYTIIDISYIQPLTSEITSFYNQKFNELGSPQQQQHKHKQQRQPQQNSRFVSKEEKGKDFSEIKLIN